MDPPGHPKTSQVPEDPQGAPKGSQGRPTALPGHPRTPQGTPKALQIRPKDHQRPLRILKACPRTPMEPRATDVRGSPRPQTPTDTMKLQATCGLQQSKVGRPTTTDGVLVTLPLIAHAAMITRIMEMVVV